MRAMREGEQTEMGRVIVTETKKACHSDWNCGTELHSLLFVLAVHAVLMLNHLFNYVGLSNLANSAITMCLDGHTQ